jgi:hypothetical protein
MAVRVVAGSDCPDFGFCVDAWSVWRDTVAI